MEIRRIRQSEAEAVTDLWDDAWLSEQGTPVIRCDVPLDEPGGELLESLGFESETTRYGLYPPLRLGSSTSNCTSSP